MNKYHVSAEFAQQTIDTMNTMTEWFITELDKLTLKANEAVEELAQHRQAIIDRETIIAKLKEIIDEPRTTVEEPKYGIGEIQPDGGVLHSDGWIRYPHKSSLMGYD